jgi:hypothetical protein
MSEIVRDRTAKSGNTVPPEEVREQLGRILASREFHASKRSRDFLQYVVEKALAGQTDDLKERTIGMEVFGRPSSYEPSSDATVRVKAGELRKRIASYYSGSGAGDEVRIDLPPGGYVPEFSYAVAPAGDTAQSAVTPARRSWLLAVWAMILLACIAGGFLYVRARTAGQGALARFWGRAFAPNSAVILCISPVPVYGLHPDVETARRMPKTADDFVLLPNNFVGAGDVLALGRITSMLADMRKGYHIRMGNEVSFHDLRDSPAVLIGYSYTKWNELNEALRYRIAASSRPPVITDYGKPTQWTLPNLKADRTTDEDYAIVARLPHKDTSEMLVIVAGITEYGSEAASDLVTDEDRLAAALRGLPDGWERKNLELVLHVRVISGAAGSPTVVAAHSW